MTASLDISHTSVDRTSDGEKIIGTDPSLSFLSELTIKNIKSPASFEFSHFNKIPIENFQDCACIQI